MEATEIEERQKPVWHIRPMDVEEIGIRNANGDISEYIRGLIRKDEVDRQKTSFRESKIKKIGILQIIVYLFISIDLLVIAIVYFSSEIIVMSITIASGALFFLYSGIMIAQKLVGEKKWSS